MANMLKKTYKGTIDRMQRDFEAGDLSRFPELGRNVLNEFLRNNLYKYDVIIMKDTDTGTQTYIVADKGPVHPVRNGSQDGQKNNARGGARGSAPGRTSWPLRKWKPLPAFRGMKVL